MASFTDQIRQAARQSGYGVRELAREIEVDPSRVSRFLNGSEGMTLDTIDRLAVVLGLRVCRDRKARSRPGGSGQEGADDAKK